MSHNLYQEFAKDGKLILEYQHTNGIKDGYYREWYKNGNEKKLTMFKEGKPHGVFQSWHPNGNISIIGMHENGTRFGEIKSWDETGRLIYSCNYLSGGKAHGIYYECDNNGIETRLYYWNGIQKKFDINQVSLIIDFLNNNGFEVVSNPDKTTNTKLLEPK